MNIAEKIEAVQHEEESYMFVEYGDNLIMTLDYRTHHWILYLEPLPGCIDSSIVFINRHNETVYTADLEGHTEHPATTRKSYLHCKLEDLITQFQRLGYHKTALAVARLGGVSESELEFIAGISETLKNYTPEKEPAEDVQAIS